MEKSLVKNASDSKQVKQAGKLQRRLEDRAKNDLKVVLSTAEGRRWIWALLGKTYVFDEAMNPSGSWMAYNLGKQDIGQKLFNEIGLLYPESLYTMMRESQSDRKANENEFKEEENQKENEEGEIDD